MAMGVGLAPGMAMVRNWDCEWEWVWVLGMRTGMGMGKGMGGTPLQLKRRVHVRVIIGAKNCTTVKTKMKIACHMRLYTKFEGLIGEIRLTDTVEYIYSEALVCNKAEYFSYGTCTYL